MTRGPTRSRTTGRPSAGKAGVTRVRGGDDKGSPSNARHARPTVADGASETLSPTEAATLLGVGKTKAYHLLLSLIRVDSSSARRPRYRREDVEALLGPKVEKSVTRVTESTTTESAEEMAQRIFDEIARRK